MNTSKYKLPHMMDLQKHYNDQISSLRFTIKKEFTYVLFFLFLLISSILFFTFLDPFYSDYSSVPFSLVHLIPNRHKSSSSLKVDCDYSRGSWVRDESYQSYYTERCSFLDPGFRCRQNGRKNDEYTKWRWQPEECDLPRFNATDILQRARNGRIVFAGDSIGRNQWESLLCMLSQAVSNKSSIYEVNGNPISRHRGYLSMKFHEYNLTVEYYRAPFLVFMGHPPKNSSDQIRTAITVDVLHSYSKQWVGADVLVVNTGHWWNQDKTIKMGCYFQEGEKVNITMDVVEGFRKALQTWKTWALQNMVSDTGHVFFRSYSPVHYRDGTWNDGGHCHTSNEPETNYTKLEAEPWNNIYISDVIKQMQYSNNSVQLLNITYLTELRKDGHPSLHREPGTPVDAPQDCSHWCLPGVPDTWNELLYAQLLLKGFSVKWRSPNYQRK